MRVLIVGLGSMGRRRLRLLKQLSPDVFICGVDAVEERRIAAQREEQISTYSSIAEAVASEKTEAAIVSSSPLSHAAIIRECLENNLHVFTEMNLVSDGYAENMALAERKQKVLFLSSTFLYREEPRYIIAKAKASTQPLNYRYHVGQYLPDWHPWEDYTKYFIGDTRTNGCREIFAIELPWLCAAFGPVEDVQVIHNKVTNLNIGYDDSYMVLLRHSCGHMGSLCVDVMARKAVRLFELYGEEVYMTWDGTPDTLQEWDIKERRNMSISLYDNVEHQSGYASFVVENAYSAELAAYIDAIENGTKPIYGFEEDMGTISWLDIIEE